MSLLINEFPGRGESNLRVDHDPADPPHILGYETFPVPIKSISKVLVRLGHQRRDHAIQAFDLRAEVGRRSFIRNALDSLDHLIGCIECLLGFDQKSPGL